MSAGATVILDVGKTHSKLSLWDANSCSIVRRARRNSRVEGAGYLELDTAAIEAWLIEVLSEFAQLAPVDAVIPVGHGAAAALVAGGRLFAPVMDYEDEPPAALKAVYLEGRDPFAVTGSPALPRGLNLGAQLHWLESFAPGGWPKDLQILTWPQYWAWRLCGEAACEVSSLGCHTDLWRPFDGRFSDLARSRGWAERLAPLRGAGEILGSLSAAWCSRTGLPADCRVFCGLHDSNAALLAALGDKELASCGATVLSTGTWFVAMRAPAAGEASEPQALEPGRDCLVNVDVGGRPIPSARFMGGREAELLCQRRLGVELPQSDALTSQAEAIVCAGVMALPTWTPGVGPFPTGKGAWTSPPSSDQARRAAVSLYLALVADASLDLIGSRERVVVEGRFAEDVLFARALASLRPGQRIYTSHAQDDVCYGALRLIDPERPALSGPALAAPLPVDLTGYRQDWRGRMPAERREPAL